MTDYPTKAETLAALERAERATEGPWRITRNKQPEIMRA